MESFVRKHQKTQNATSAFDSKNLDGYMAVFYRDVAYWQLHGETTTWQQPREDVAAQFARLSRVESIFVRDQIVVIKGAKVIEYLTRRSSGILPQPDIRGLHRTGIAFFGNEAFRQPQYSPSSSDLLHQ